MLMKLKKTDRQYFEEIAHIIQDAKKKVYKSLNKTVIELYWSIGKYISEKVKSASWGKGIVEHLAEYIKNRHPLQKGFSARNIWRMKQFFEEYQGNEKLSALRTELSWTHHRLILSKTKSIEQKEFYLKLAIKESYSTRELERQLDSAYFERIMLSDKKLSPTLRKLPQDVSNVFKDTYVFEFVDLPHDHSENDLQKELLANMKEFILELGKDFSFIGQEYSLQVGMHDYYIDLLFFHRELQCLVALELKIDEFKPEFLGKLNFYLEALDRDVKKPHENPSVGVLLCANKDTEVVEYALSRTISPTLIADYETKLIDKKMLQNKLHELTLLLEKENE